jgi:hypothetical protein
LKAWGGEGAEEILGREERIVFSLPRELRDNPSLERTEQGARPSGSSTPDR